MPTKIYTTLNQIVKYGHSRLHLQKHICKFTCMIKSEEYYVYPRATRNGARLCKFYVTVKMIHTLFYYTNPSVEMLTDDFAQRNCHDLRNCSVSHSLFDTYVRNDKN